MTLSTLGFTDKFRDISVGWFDKCLQQLKELCSNQVEPVNYF